MFGLGMTELLVILAIVVIIFGATKLPQLGKGIGEAIRNFKKGVSEPPEIDVTPKKNSIEKENEEKKS
ncbi:MAG: twin-arginine translocase TatA/TatE family subunit [Thermodesulfovibrionia bacterium]|nr:twin-arginine translocase TatA/TatE family subunit [Thermodesulfovibrionia bacterium]